MLPVVSPLIILKSGFLTHSFSMFINSNYVNFVEVAKYIIINKMLFKIVSA